jgi:flagellar basal-body rod protein FlgF
MIYGMYHSAAGMLTSEYQQGVIANNLANADTVGFKRDVATFAERLRAEMAGVRKGPSDPGLGGVSGGLWLGATHTSYQEGAYEKTGVATDVALDGPGFLTVQHEGQTLLTRDGRFIVDQTGQLVSVTDGAAVLNKGGQPIRLNPNSGPLSFIDQDGWVYQNIRGNDVRVAQLGLTDVADYDALQKAGSGRFQTDPQNLAPGYMRVRIGFVEQSGVEAVPEMVNMIETARAFQMNASLVSLQDQTLGRLLTLVQ